MSQFPAAGRGFQNTPRPAVSYFVEVELIKIEKTALYCAMFCWITTMLPNTDFQILRVRVFQVF